MKLLEKFLVTFLVLFILTIFVYAANEDQSTFGTADITTCGIGGYSGVVNCTGKSYLSNATVNTSTVGDVNATTFYGEHQNQSGALDWITPKFIFDVDDEDIEGDLNTYVDIAGDNMTGNLRVGPTTTNHKVNLSTLGDVNATKFYGNFTGIIACDKIVGGPDGDFCTDVSAGVSGAWVRLNFTNAFNNIYNISDFNGTDASFKQVNMTTLNVTGTSFLEGIRSSDSTIDIHSNLTGSTSQGFILATDSNFDETIELAQSSIIFKADSYTFDDDGAFSSEPFGTSFNFEGRVDSRGLRINSSTGLSGSCGSGTTLTVLGGIITACS